MQQANQEYDDQINKLLGIAAKAGDSTTKLKEMSGKYLIDVEETWKTQFINEGTPPSQYHHGLAKGGVLRAARGLVAGILPPRNPGTLVMAGGIPVLAGEPETQGEVLTPLAGISQARAMALAQVVGDHYDFDVSPRRGRGATVLAMPPQGGADRPIVVQNQVFLDGKQLHAGLIGPSQRYKSRTGTTGLA